MQSKQTLERSFQGRLEGTEKGRTYIVMPFDPEKVWGLRPRYHVTGTINGTKVRGALEQFGKGYFLPLGPAYRRGAGLHLGDPVTVVLMPEGPQSEALAPTLSPHLRPSRKPRVSSTGWQPSIARTTCGGLMRRSAAPICV